MQKLRFPQYLGYAAGDAANNLSFSMVTIALTLYYTDVVGAGMPTKQVTAAVATLIFVVRFWDAFADIFAGQAVDRTMTRWGKFRPFILFGAAPLLFASMLCFSVPMNMTWHNKLIWAYLSYAAMGLLYSLVNIPYGSLAAAMTQDPKERAQLTGFRVIGSNLSILMINLIVMPQIQKYRGNAAGLQHALHTTTVIFIVLGIALYLLTFLTAKEQVKRTTPSISLRQSLPVLAKNRPLLMLCGSSLVFLSAMYVTQGLTAYYARDVLGNAKFAIILSVVGIAGTIVVALFAKQIVKLIGKRTGYVTFGLMAVVGGVLVWLAPTPDLSPLHTNPNWTPAASQIVLPVIAWFIFQTGVGGVNALMWALEADTVEYGEWQSGYRTEGVTYALFSFTRKMGQAIGGSIAVSSLGWFAYTAGLKTGQSAETIHGIKMGVGLIPAIILAVATAVMLAYPLTEKRFGEIMDEMAERRSPADEAAPQGPAQSDLALHS